VASRLDRHDLINKNGDIEETRKTNQCGKTTSLSLTQALENAGWLNWVAMSKPNFPSRAGNTRPTRDVLAATPSAAIRSKLACHLAAAVNGFSLPKFLEYLSSMLPRPDPTQKTVQEVSQSRKLLQAKTST
jgi:hypothetical protein